MIRRLVIALMAFAAAFAVGRYVPLRSGTPSREPGEAVGGRSIGGSFGTAPSSNAAPHAQDTRGRKLTTFATIPGHAPPPSPWLSHVMLDPDHHSGDASRILEAVFSNTDALAAFNECMPLFPRTESRLRLRATVKISRQGIEVGPVEDVEVTDGVELTDAARACILGAFHHTSMTTPLYPDEVHPYHGPFDLPMSVVNDSKNSHDGGGQ